MLFYVPTSYISPAAGLLAWEWVSLMAPQRLVYGFGRGLYFAGVIAATTLLGWLMSRERKRFPSDALPWLLLLFFLWITFNLLFVPFPDRAWHYWNRYMRTFVEIFVAFTLLNKRTRIHAMVWVMAISVGFISIKGGMFTIVTGGRDHVLGPPGTPLADNNQLALAEVMVLPLLYYLSRHSQFRFIRIGLLAVMVLQSLAIFGSYSRGGMVAYSVMLFLFWLRARNKITYIIFGGLFVALGLSFMPAAFWDRMHTLSHASTTNSFESRFRSWKVAFYYARDNFPFGAGFYCPQLGAIYHRYFPDNAPFAAHSIYFQVLGEQGFPGFALYLSILLMGLRNCRVAMRLTRHVPELEWAHDLARMTWVGLIGFYVGGAALSLAYFNAFMMLLVITSSVPPGRRHSAQSGRPESRSSLALSAKTQPGRARRLHAGPAATRNACFRRA